MDPWLAACLPFAFAVGTYSLAAVFELLIRLASPPRRRHGD